MRLVWTHLSWNRSSRLILCIIYFLNCSFLLINQTIVFTSFIQLNLSYELQFANDLFVRDLGASICYREFNSQLPNQPNKIKIYLFTFDFWGQWTYSGVAFDARNRSESIRFSIFNEHSIIWIWIVWSLQVTRCIWFRNAIYKNVRNIEALNIYRNASYVRVALEKWFTL